MLLDTCTVKPLLSQSNSSTAKEPYPMSLHCKFTGFPWKKCLMLGGGKVQQDLLVQHETNSYSSQSKLTLSLPITLKQSPVKGLEVDMMDWFCYYISNMQLCGLTQLVFTLDSEICKYHV